MEEGVHGCMCRGAGISYFWTEAQNEVVQPSYKPLKIEVCNGNTDISFIVVTQI